MRSILMCTGLLALVMSVPTAAAAVLPEPTNTEVIDVPNDDGTALGVLWEWIGDTTADTQITLEVEVAGDVIQEYALNAAQAEKLANKRAILQEKLGPVQQQMYAAQADAQDILVELQFAEANRSPDARQIRHNYWLKQNEYTRLLNIRNKAWDVFSGRVTSWSGGNLFEKDLTARYAAETLGRSSWVTTGEVEALGQVDGAWPTKGDATHRFGHDPADSEKVYYEISSYFVVNPDVLNGTYTEEPDEIDYIAPRKINLPFEKNTLYNVRLVVMEGDERAVYDLGGGTPRVNFFNNAVLNNLLFAVGFAIIILVAIMLARRNPNMFIRRISGLEAVDEAIGRATEMGKPVLYLCGLDPLSTLSTLAAVNILGRVARRIADYDSDLIVPNRDPVVLTVAQEVVREAYIDQGRPDAYKEDNIFFVTDDQFSFTATTCAIMMREKPAANFFMGGYYAESLLLAETGASTGAIQIAGTDSLHQLPFFITTCDYTLIGEELYAASAYLSREPMLLGSLKGQDLGKAIVMVLIIIQTLLFAINADWNWLKLLVEPL